MSTIYLDSFAHYSDILSKWDAAGDNQIVFNSAIARTGAGCLQIVSGASGPARVLPANYTRLIAGVAFKLDTPGVGQQTTILQFQLNGVGYNLAVRVLGDSSFSVVRGNPNDAGSVLLFFTAGRCAVWNQWNYVVCAATFSDTNGSVDLWVNGRLVGSVAGVRTTAQLGSQFSNAFELFGAPGNGAHSFLADLVILDPTVSPNTTPLQGAKVYVTVPTANGAPVNWTPLAGSNWQNVSEVPPDGDTSYNSATTIGQLDQYLHPLPSPGDADIASVQHCLDLKMAVGSLNVSSVVAGTVFGTGFAVTGAYKIWCAQYDNNPNTLAGFLPSDFPLAAGPEVTA